MGSLHVSGYAPGVLYALRAQHNGHGRVRRQGFDAHRWLAPRGLAALPHGGATQKALSLLDVSPRE